MNHLFRHAGCIAVLLASTVTGAREVYKWVDAQGKVHYGDRPAGAKAEKLDIKAQDPKPDEAAAARDERTRKILDQYTEERTEAVSDRAKAAEEQAKRKANCEQARDALEKIQNAGYIYDQDKNGEHIILSDAQRASMEAEAQKAVDAWCKPQS